MPRSLRDLVQRLKEAKTGGAREGAYLDLDEFTPTRRDLAEIYRALRQCYPDDRSRVRSTRRDLLDKLVDIHDTTTVKFIRDLYPSLPPNRQIRQAALEVLAQINTRPALRALCRILVAERSKPCLEDTSLFWTVLVCPQNAGVMFPELLALLSNESLREGVYAVAAAALDGQSVMAEALRPTQGRILRDFEEANRLYKMTSPDSSAYTGAVEYLSAIVTVMKAFVDDPELRMALQAAVGHENAQVAFAAYRACRAVGSEDACKAIERFAADPSTRLDLFELLRAARQIDRFPQEWQTQESFAEADMVRWLMHPNEYGQPPQKIKLVKARIVSLQGKKGRLYIYKFTYPSNPRRWLVGVSGLQPSDPRKTVTAGPFTFSDSRTLRGCDLDELGDLLGH